MPTPNFLIYLDNRTCSCWDLQSYSSAISLASDWAICVRCYIWWHERAMFILLLIALHLNNNSNFEEQFEVVTDCVIIQCTALFLALVLLYDCTTSFAWSYVLGFIPWAIFWIRPCNELHASRSWSREGNKHKTWRFTTHLVHVTQCISLLRGACPRPP